jgi:hypothetical protein
MRYVIFIILALIAFSCSPERRLARLVKKHPHLLVKDTLTIQDTTIVKGTKLDSNFYFQGDTVYILDSILTIKYFYNKETQKHFIEGQVKPDTIYKTIRVPYDKIIVKPLTWWQENKDWIILVAFCLFVATSVCKIFRQ